MSLPVRIWLVSTLCILITSSLAFPYCLHNFQWARENGSSLIDYTSKRSLFTSLFKEAGVFPKINDNISSYFLDSCLVFGVHHNRQHWFHYDSHIECLHSQPTGQSTITIYQIRHHHINLARLGPLLMWLSPDHVASSHTTTPRHIDAPDMPLISSSAADMPLISPSTVSVPTQKRCESMYVPCAIQQSQDCIAHSQNPVIVCQSWDCMTQHAGPRLGGISMEPHNSQDCTLVNFQLFA